LLLLVGFIGVSMMVQPGFGMSSSILFALLAGCCYGSYLATTRLVAEGHFQHRFCLSRNC
jgi:drug/metabolite transporter (DMT)-like permease